MPFITYRFSDGISLIQEAGVANFMRCNIWLVRGRDRDLIIDTGMGLESLKDWISGEADRPLTAVTTHAHFDHIAGLHEFDERLGHRSEAGIYAAPTQATTVYTGAWKQITIVDPTVHPAFDPVTFAVTPTPLTGYLDEGDVLDLGDRAFQILHLPGHSPGSIGLLDRDAQVLFSGDAVYDGELLDNLYHSDPLVYRETLQRIAALDAEVFHAGHFPSFGRRRMSELVTSYLGGRNTITDVVEWYEKCCRGNREIFSEQDWSGAPMLDRQSDGGLSVVLFFAAGVWGLYWVPLRILESGGLTDAWSVAVFNACPLILLLPYAFLARRRLYPHLRNILLIGGLTGCGLSLYATGLVASTVVRATILFYLTPVWSTIIGVLWLSERLGAGRVAAILLGIAGLACLVIGSDDSTPPLNVGDVLALLSGVFWGLGAASLKRHPETPVGGSMVCMILATAVISFGLGFLLFPDPFPSVAQLAGSLPVAVPAALIVLVPTAYLILWIARKLYPGRVGILMMSEVLVAILSASLFLPEETMSAVQWVGASAIILSCLIEVLFEHKSGPVLSS